MLITLNVPGTANNACFSCTIYSPVKIWYITVTHSIPARTIVTSVLSSLSLSLDTIIHYATRLFYMQLKIFDPGCSSSLHSPPAYGPAKNLKV